MASRKDVKELADRLISTLDTMMPSDKADAIVRDVAEALYRDILGVPGKIVIDTTQATGHVHIGGSKGHKKSVAAIAKYKFEMETK